MSAKERYLENLYKWSDIQSHLPRLCEAAKGNCMEIGVRTGFSTSALLAGIEEHGGHLWSFDANDCGDVFKGHPNWTFNKMDSIGEVKKIHEIVPPLLDLLFVDGDHSYDGCYADLINYGGTAKKVLVHDTDAPDYPGVLRAVQDYMKETGRHGTFHFGSFGMAEIQ